MFIKGLAHGPTERDEYFVGMPFVIRYERLQQNTAMVSLARWSWGLRKERNPTHVTTNGFPNLPRSSKHPPYVWCSQQKQVWINKNTHNICVMLLLMHNLYTFSGPEVHYNFNILFHRFSPRMFQFMISGISSITVPLFLSSWAQCRVIFDSVISVRVTWHSCCSGIK